jgi:ubiquitin-like-conjugating enzyme ATG3
MSNILRSKISSLRDYLTPINHQSNFSKTGEISPEEFVKAGDYLVYKFPTWEWGKCPKNLQKSYLPPDKQYLVTKKVPSYQRANVYLNGGNSELEEDEEEEEEEVQLEGVDGEEREEGAVEGEVWVKSKGITRQNQQVNDLDDLIDENAEQSQDDEFNDLEVIDNCQDSLRKYDLFISYSTSYRVPKLYLVGYNSNGIPLLPKQMFDDINLDYKDKTATIEQLPVSYDTTAISIHPCKHANVMKVLMNHSKLKHEKNVPNLKKLSLQDSNNNNSNNNNNNKYNGINDDDDDDDDDDNNFGIRVDQYLVIFLKFIASVTPGIEYDYTMDAL